MAEIEHKSFFRTRKVLALLPLLLMGVGVWYFIYGRTLRHGQDTASVPAGKIFGAAASPAGKPSAAPAPKSSAPGNGAAAVLARYHPELHVPRDAGVW